MTTLLSDIEAANIIGGYYLSDNDAVTKRRTRKLIRKSGIKWQEEGREVFIRRSDVPQLLEAITWQSSPLREKTPQVGGYVERIRGGQCTKARELCTPINRGHRKSLNS